MLPILEKMIPITQSDSRFGRFMCQHFRKAAQHIDHYRILNTHPRLNSRIGNIFECVISKAL